MKPYANIILRDAIVFPSLGGRPTAVAITGGTIAAVGDAERLMRLCRQDTEVIDCNGIVLIPGIVDAHCHVFAAADTLNRVDCRPSATAAIDSVIAALQTAGPRHDGWIRGYGYDDSPFGLGRHLDRVDLDSVSTDLPVRVDHRSGHATVLNSVGLNLVGISDGTPDPPGGAVVRDQTGKPTGLLLEMAEWLSARIDSSNKQKDGDPSAAMRAWSQRMLGYGITAVTDAGPGNGIRRWREFEKHVDAGTLRQRVDMMVGHHRIREMLTAGLTYGDRDHGDMLRVGPAKVMLAASSGQLHPDPDRLSQIVRTAHDAGFPVAIHAVERDAVVAAALAIGENPAPFGRDRIEHCGECPPDVAQLVATSGAQVVSNPGFLHYDGERYLQTVPDDMLPHLYPAGALDSLGVPVTLASDTPVVDANPWATMAGAVTRRTANGSPLGGAGLPSVADALHKHTGANRIEPGCPADLALVYPNPFSLEPDALPTVRAVLTMVAGRVVRRAGPQK